MTSAARDQEIRGHCLCHSVSFTLTGPHNWIGHCHCESCRRGAGAPVVTFIGHPNAQWQWTAKTPTSYMSSEGNYRYFCPECGSSVAYASDRYPEEMHFHAALLEHPERLTPTETYHASESLSWDLTPRH